MPALVLDRLWLNLASDPSTSLSFFTAEGGESDAIPGEVRTTASGRRRIVTTPGSDRGMLRTLRLVTAEEVETLRSWRGVGLLVRDNRGALLYATFFSIGRSDWQDGTYDVAIDLVAYTSTDEV